MESERRLGRRDRERLRNGRYDFNRDRIVEEEEGVGFDFDLEDLVALVLGIWGLRRWRVRGWRY